MNLAPGRRRKGRRELILLVEREKRRALNPLQMLEWEGRCGLSLFLELKKSCGLAPSKSGTRGVGFALLELETKHKIGPLLEREERQS